MFHSAAFLCSSLDHGSLSVGENLSVVLAMSMVTVYHAQGKVRGSSRRNIAVATGYLTSHIVSLTVPQPGIKPHSRLPMRF